MERNVLIRQILQVCRDQRWEALIDVSGHQWHADVMVNYANYHVAFNVNRRFTHVNQTYHAMRKQRVCGCWLAIDELQQMPCYGYECQPLFQLNEVFHNVSVQVNAAMELPLAGFVTALVKGRIRRLQQLTPRFIDVYVVKTGCAWCLNDFSIFYLRRIHTKEGVTLVCRKDFDEDFSFNPFVYRSVLEFAEEHRQLGHMADLRRRHNATSSSDLFSFGCPHCKNIMGNLFLGEVVRDTIHEVDNGGVHRINVENSGLTLPFQQWGVINDSCSTMLRKGIRDSSE